MKFIKDAPIRECIGVFLVVLLLQLYLRSDHRLGSGVNSKWSQGNFRKCRFPGSSLVT